MVHMRSKWEVKLISIVFRITICTFLLIAPALGQGGEHLQALAEEICRRGKLEANFPEFNVLNLKRPVRLIGPLSGRSLSAPSQQCRHGKPLATGTFFMMMSQFENPTATDLRVQIVLYLTSTRGGLVRALREEMELPILPRCAITDPACYIKYSEIELTDATKRYFEMEKLYWQFLRPH